MREDSERAGTQPHRSALDADGVVLMASNNYWMKLWFDILRDPKMGMLPDRLWRRVIELFLLAGQNSEDGILPDVEEIAWQLNKSAQAINNDLEKIRETGIVARNDDGVWFVTNFKKRNAPVKNAKRVKDFRRRERYEKSNEDVTEVKRECNETLQLRYQEEQKNRLTDLTTTTTVLPSDFQPFAEVYELVTGSEPKLLNAEIEAVSEILKAGGTPDDFRSALQGMQDKDYTIASMASALTWTLKDINKRKQPKRPNNVGRKPLSAGLDEILADAPIFAEDK